MVLNAMSYLGGLIVSNFYVMNSFIYVIIAIFYVINSFFYVNITIFI
ncbi:hypothetical protein GCM10007199_35270 [Fictibacillus barbaricus]|nr:hypothetical protein GCM10007199_35270 [Fictibacillus barbaricus]